MCVNRVNGLYCSSGGYIPVQVGYIPVPDGYIPIKDGYIPKNHHISTNKFTDFNLELSFTHWAQLFQHYTIEI